MLIDKYMNNFLYNMAYIRLQTTEQRRHSDSDIRGTGKSYLKRNVRYRWNTRHIFLNEYRRFWIEKKH